jgi:hypothetical protein
VSRHQNRQRTSGLWYPGTRSSTSELPSCTTSFEGHRPNIKVALHHPELQFPSAKIPPAFHPPSGLAGAHHQLQCFSEKPYIASIITFRSCPFIMIPPRTSRRMQQGRVPQPQRALTPANHAVLLQVRLTLGKAVDKRLGILPNSHGCGCWSIFFTASSAAV